MKIRLKEIRKKHGYTQKELASQISVSESLISYWESGKRLPRLKEVNKLLNLFNISYDMLIEEDI